MLFYCLCTIVCHDCNVQLSIVCLGSIETTNKKNNTVEAFFYVFFAEYCPAVTNFELQWPRISLGENITNDCSAINSSWTGTYKRYRVF